MEEVVAGAAAPWILERDKRTSGLVNGLTGDAEYVAAGGKGSAAARGKGRRPIAGTQFFTIWPFLKKIYVWPPGRRKLIFEPWGSALGLMALK